jgi:Fur family ferric uptake transcriptional regulator
MNFENKNLFQEDDLRHFLRQRGLKYTRQREAVWSAFRALKAHHPSCEEIYYQSRMINPRLSWATLYRTLRWMKELGVVVARDFGNGRNRFETGEKGLTHGHLVCWRCGKVIDLKDRMIESFWKKAAKKYRFEVFRERVEGYGLCAECERKKHDFEVLKGPSVIYGQNPKRDGN